MDFETLVKEIEKQYGVSYKVVEVGKVPEGGEIVKCWAFGRIDKKPPKTILEVCLVRLSSGRYVRVVTRKATIEKKEEGNGH